MRYKPDISRYTYPDKTDCHMLQVKHIVDTNFDENHQYYNKKFYYRVIRFFTRILVTIIGYPIMFFRYGLKVEGRKNAKALRKSKKSYLSICNHVFAMDYLCVLKAMRPKMGYFLAWPINFEGPNRNFIKMAGGMPIPTTIRGLAKYQKDLDQAINDGQWMHVYPEGSMWWYYPYIRPLKKGSFKIAYRHKLDILPMAISFRPRKGFFKLYARKTPLVTIRVGEPISFNYELSEYEAIADMQKRSYHIMQLLAGIDENDPDYCTIENFDEKIRGIKRED